jgi:hypothetical protein
VSANRPVWLIVRHILSANRLQSRKPCFRSIRFRDRSGISNSGSDRLRDANQPLVEQGYRRPIGSTGTSALCVYGLNCSFKLKSAGASLFECFAKMAFRLFDQRKRPLLRVLLRKGNISAVKPSPRGASCFAME